MLFQGTLGTLQLQAVSQVVMGSGWTINGKGEADEVIIPPLILTQLPLGAVKGNGGTEEEEVRWGKTLK